MKKKTDFQELFQLLSLADLSQNLLALNISPLYMLTEYEVELMQV